MTTILHQALALGLAVSQALFHPDEVRRTFNPQTEQQLVLARMKAGCESIMRDVGVPADVDFDELLVLLSAGAGASSLPRGIAPQDLSTVYRAYCKGESQNPELIAGALRFYNATLAALPDPRRLAGWRVRQSSDVLSSTGAVIASAHFDDNRRRWIPLSRFPMAYRNAVIAAEDRNFYQHKGVEIVGVARAVMTSFQRAESGRRPDGGSTILQQLIKNTLLLDLAKREQAAPRDQSRELGMTRKISEIVLATEIETRSILSKDQILELYLNEIYFGRAAWGAGLAAQAYFGKPVWELTLPEIALLAALPKGPNGLDPARNPNGATLRAFYVLSQMRENGALPQAELERATAALPAMIQAAAASRRDPPRMAGGRHFMDYLRRSIFQRTNLDIRENPMTVRTTMDPALQDAVELAVQEGLAQYELTRNRATFVRAEANLAAQVQRLSADTTAPADAQPAWRRALTSAWLPLGDVRWMRAIAMQQTPPAAPARPGAPAQGRPAANAPQAAPRWVAGLTDGRVLPLRAWNPSVLSRLQPFDVVYVMLSRDGTAAELRVRPRVQGSAVVMEARTGRILALSGGFSFGVSQLNRATDARRQPGSTAKPLSYLAALSTGLTPSTRIPDSPVNLPPLSTEAPWRPNNDEPTSEEGTKSLAQGLIGSINRVTANMLDMIYPGRPDRSLDLVATAMRQCGMYSNLPRVYSIILGTAETTLLQVASCYATLANGGVRTVPRAFERVELDRWVGNDLQRTTVLDGSRMPTRTMTVGDENSFFQLRQLMQGTVEGGTASSISQTLRDLVPQGARVANYVAGKTGTTNRSNDSWFVGFTSELVIGVWVGYDNGVGQTAMNLGAGASGATVAVPIFSSIVRATTRTRPLTPFSTQPTPRAADPNRR